MLCRPGSRWLASSLSRARTLSQAAGRASRCDQHLAAESGDLSRAKVDAGLLVARDLDSMFLEIHSELKAEMRNESELNDMAKYYFDGQGKAIRPVIAMTVGHAVNHNCNQTTNATVLSHQRKVAIISEMIHTASLVHDDVLDHAETRRGKEAVNRKWDITRSAMCGDFILAVGSKILAQIRNEDVVIILSQVLADLVKGEFQQLQNKSDDAERFQLYLQKTFNKTASLMAYSCKANAVLSAGSLDHPVVEEAFQYGRNIGIAFQLVDDLLDFVASSAQLGKPAGADLELGLATAPVLFASSQYPELKTMIARRFSGPGDVKLAFEAVLSSDGLDKTRALAGEHCQQAMSVIQAWKESSFKAALQTITESVLNRLK